MKLSSYIAKNGHSTFGIVAFDAGKPIGLIDLGDSFPSLRDLLAAPNGLDFARARVATKPNVAFDGVRLLPVIPNPDKIFCVGLNYASHVKETGRPMPEKPMIFGRYSASQVGANENMHRPKVSEHFDYEGELAVIIGKRSRYVPSARALERVAGYSCYNDGSVRDWQKHSQQFTPGKNFPRTGAFGPWMVTADEMPELCSHTLKTRLNGEEVQSASFDDLIFDVPTLVAYCSSFITLEPGDVIVTGTTGGVGSMRQPPLWMKAGDTVEVEISGIGILRNPVADEPADASI